MSKLLALFILFHCCKKPRARALFHHLSVLPKLHAHLILFIVAKSQPRVPCSIASLFCQSWVCFWFCFTVAAKPPARALDFVPSLRHSRLRTFFYWFNEIPKLRALWILLHCYTKAALCFLLLSVKLRLSVLCYIVTQVFLAFFVWCGLHELVTSVYDYVVSSPQVVFFPSFEYEHVIRKNSVNRYILTSHEFQINLGETSTYQLEQLWQQLRVR